MGYKVSYDISLILLQSISFPKTLLDSTGLGSTQKEKEMDRVGLEQYLSPFIAAAPFDR
jgi:hypothetical protein